MRDVTVCHGWCGDDPHGLGEARNLTRESGRMIRLCDGCHRVSMDYTATAIVKGALEAGGPDAAEGVVKIIDRSGGET